jgi:hypothetical protein
MGFGGDVLATAAEEEAATDPLVLDEVVALLGGQGRSDGSPRQRVPADGPARSEPPGDVHSVGVEASGAGAGADGSPIDDGGDDGGLTGEVEFDK